MTNEDSVGDALRKAIDVPTDTMITLDIPLLLTKLSRVPAVPVAEREGEAAPDRVPGV